MSKVTWSIPVIVMMIFTIISVLITIFSRVQALRKNQIPMNDFRTMDFCKKENPWLEITSRHLDNLFQMPILFYICFIIIMTNAELMQITYFLVLGWLFVSFRIINSIIHLTINDLSLRLFSFLLSLAFLFTMIVMLFIELLKTN
ncbi:MAPEG family protein [Fastidiosibacter lacustris]|uniref:MAPEG family protein n=1 Tax=Fastidiosibacter lacustris TaxID=2056695 RepID=UPI000E35138F|nr:MAPEG family protein [Fastidiosibacter lacustris]